MSESINKSFNIKYRLIGALALICFPLIVLVMFVDSQPPESNSKQARNKHLSKQVILNFRDTMTENIEATKGSTDRSKVNLSPVEEHVILEQNILSENQVNKRVWLVNVAQTMDRSECKRYLKNLQDFEMQPSYHEDNLNCKVTLGPFRDKIKAEKERSKAILVLGKPATLEKIK